MGTEAMGAAVSTCSTCVTTPSIIVADLQVSPGRVSWADKRRSWVYV